MSPHCPPYPLRLCGASLSPCPLIYNWFPSTPPFIVPSWQDHDPGWIYLCPLCQHLHGQVWLPGLTLSSSPHLQVGPWCLLGTPTSFPYTIILPLLKTVISRFSPPSSNPQSSSLILSADGLASWFSGIIEQWADKFHVPTTTPSRPPSSVPIHSAFPPSTEMNFPRVDQQYSVCGPQSWLAASASSGTLWEVPIL